MAPAHIGKLCLAWSAPMGCVAIQITHLVWCGVIESPLWWPGVPAGGCGLAKKGEPAIGHFGIRRHEAMVSTCRNQLHSPHSLEEVSAGRMTEAITDFALRMPSGGQSFGGLSDPNAKLWSYFWWHQAVNKDSWKDENVDLTRYCSRNCRAI
jgi:hypothetical protein